MKLLPKYKKWVINVIENKKLLEKRAVIFLLEYNTR